MNFYIDQSDCPKRLRLSPDGQILALERAKIRSLDQYGTPARYKAYLVHQTHIHRHTIARCLDHREMCNFDTVDQICSVLELQWDQVCELSNTIDEGAIATSSSSQNLTSKAAAAKTLAATNNMVDQVRQAVAQRIQRECGTVMMSRYKLPINQLVEPSLYTISYLPSEQFKSPDLLTGNIDVANFDRMGIIPQYEMQTDGKTLLQQHHRLLVYASPGCGKTSYLKWLAIQCMEGTLLPNCVPIFISMRAFSPQALHKSLHTFIEEYLMGCGVQNVSYIAHKLFQSGRVFLLLDGLDEVPGAVRGNVECHITEILNRSFHSYYAFSCRLGLKLSVAETFQKTVIALFNMKQRTQYVQRWFRASNADATLERQFRDRLRHHINFGELTRTPLLLDLLCRVFRDHQAFPNTRAGVYDCGLDSLLKEESRNLRTSSTLGKLTIKHTRHLLQIIASDYFLMPQLQTLFDRKEVERKIETYLQTHLRFDPASFSARKIIEDIEITYGLLTQPAANYCSFSHLTFQEYFTAEYLVKQNQYAIAYHHITQPQWRFVIELIAELLPASHTPAFFKGYKQALDQLVRENSKIQRFLRWIDSMALALLPEINTQRPHQLTLLRAWYFAFSLDHPPLTQNIGHVARQFEFPDFDCATSVIRSKTLDVHRLFYEAYHATVTYPQHTSDHSQSPDSLTAGLTMMPRSTSASYRVHDSSGRYDARGFIRLVDRIYGVVRHNPALENHIAGWRMMIQQQLENHRIPQDWWHHRRSLWHRKVSKFMQSRYDLQCQWNFTQQEKTLLRHYYDATKLLSICMNRSRQLPSDLYQSLAERLLLIEPLS